MGFPGDIYTMPGQPTPALTYPPRNSRPYQRLINHCFPLIRPYYIKPLFQGEGYVREGPPVPPRSKGTYFRIAVFGSKTKVVRNKHDQRFRNSQSKEDTR